MRKGELAEEREEAVVRQVTGELAGDRDLVEKAGEIVRREIEEYIKKYGNLSIGEATTTNAGDLPCEKVIHVAGPVYPKNNVRDQKQRDGLKSTIKSILREMKKQNMNSVSFPAISTGHFNFPHEICALIIGDVLREAIDNDTEFYKDKKLIICNPDEKRTKTMLEFIPRCFETK